MGRTVWFTAQQGGEPPHSLAVTRKCAHWLGRLFAGVGKMLNMIVCLWWTKKRNRSFGTVPFFLCYLQIRTTLQGIRRLQQVTGFSRQLQDGRLRMLHRTTLLLCQELRK